MLLQKKQIAGLIASLEALQTDINAKPSLSQVNDAIAASIAALVDGAPTALDTLKELADALANEQDALNALITTIEGKASLSAVQDLTTRVEGLEQIALSHTTAIEEVGNTAASAYNLAGDALTAAQNAQNTADEAMFVAQAASHDAASAFQAAQQTAQDLSTLDAKVQTKLSGFEASKLASVSATSPTSPDVATIATDPTRKPVFVTINGQTFPIGTASTEAFYLVSDTLKMNVGVAGFNLETTDVIYVYSTVTE